MSDAIRTLTRREALKAGLAGGALAATGLLGGLASGTATAATAAGTQSDQTLLEDIADILLPTTATSPGAKAAGVGTMMARVLADCESPETQQRVAAGLRGLRETSRARGGDFASLPLAERERMIRDIDTLAQQEGDIHWFNSVRMLAVNAYFTSEVGLTQAMRYVPVPGRYDGCVPLEPGQPAWA
ncbi:gluconate 2-dehydrogenase subunit 3 family protein [Pseudoxanthomonas beigongshangi]